MHRLPVYAILPLTAVTLFAADDRSGLDPHFVGIPQSIPVSVTVAMVTP
jgi:hypothetical protein